ITTVAGNGRAGFSGDGGPATFAELDGVNDMVETPDGGLLIADMGNNRVRRVSPDGTITTVAGNGEGGWGVAGEGGPATRARLNGPAGLALNPGGGFLVADAGNNRVHLVDTDLGAPAGAETHRATP